MKAIELVAGHFPYLKKGDTGAAVLKMMSDQHVRHLALVEDRQLIGVISDEDILNAHGVEEAVGSLPLSFVRPFIHDYEHVFEVLRVVMEYRLTAIPVLDEHEFYLGMITHEHLLFSIASETDILEPGGTIVLELDVQNYQASEITQILESHNARLLCLFTKTVQETGKMEVTLKINTAEFQPILASFRRFSYTIKETFTEPEHSDNLRERYDALMNYLRI